MFSTSTSDIILLWKFGREPTKKLHKVMKPVPYNTVGEKPMAKESKTLEFFTIIEAQSFWILTQLQILGDLQLGTTWVFVGHASLK